MNSDFSSRPRTDGLQVSGLEAPLQQLLNQQHRFSASKALTWRQRWVKSLVNFLVGAQTISITEKLMPNGSSRWIVYDPSSDTRHIFTSRAAVRTWLEQRYYR